MSRIKLVVVIGSVSTTVSMRQDALSASGLKNHIQRFKVAESMLQEMQRHARIMQELMIKKDGKLAKFTCKGYPLLKRLGKDAPYMRELNIKVKEWYRDLMKEHSLDWEEKDVDISMTVHTGAMHKMKDRPYELHHDRCEAFILVYVLLDNHNQGATIAQIPQNPEKYNTRSYALRSQYWTLKMSPGDALFLHDEKFIHGGPHMIPNDPKLPMIRGWFRIKHKPKPNDRTFSNRYMADTTKNTNISITALNEHSADTARQRSGMLVKWLEYSVICITLGSCLWWLRSMIWY